MQGGFQNPNNSEFAGLICRAATHAMEVCTVGGLRHFQGGHDHIVGRRVWLLSEVLSHVRLALYKNAWLLCLAAQDFEEGERHRLRGLSVWRPGSQTACLLHLGIAASKDHWDSWRRGNRQLAHETSWILIYTTAALLPFLSYLPGLWGRLWTTDLVL